MELILNQFNRIFMSCCKSSKMISKTLSHLYIVLLSAKLHTSVLSRKRKRSLINKLNNSRPEIDPCGTVLICHTNHNMRNLLLCAVFDLISTLVKDLILIYRCRKLQSLQSEGHVASSRRL